MNLVGYFYTMGVLILYPTSVGRAKAEVFIYERHRDICCRWSHFNDLATLSFLLFEAICGASTTYRTVAELSDAIITIVLVHMMKVLPTSRLPAVTGLPRESSFAMPAHLHLIRDLHAESHAAFNGRICR